MSHSYSNILIHAVYSTKRRLPLLTDKADRNQLHCYTGGILRKNGAIPLGINGVEDHIHILMSIHPDQSVAQVIKESKRASSIWIKSQGTNYSGFSWQRGYGAFSVSESIKDKVQNYIARQEEHHRRFTFMEEWEAFMRTNGLPSQQPRHSSG